MACSTSVPGGDRLGPSTASSSTPRPRRRIANEEEWEDEVEHALGPPSDSTSDFSENRTHRASLRVTPQKVGVRVGRPSGRSSPVVRSPARPTRSGNVVRQKRSDMAISASTPSLKDKGKAESGGSSFLVVQWLVHILSKSLLGTIRIVHTILAPFYPYLFLTVFALLALSGATYYLINILPSLVFRLPGNILHAVLPRLRLEYWTYATDFNVALGQGLALLPLRTLATPSCMFFGQFCSLSLLSDTNLTELDIAKPFWEWRRRENAEVDIGGVARSLVKEAKGAKDIFESVALLSEGGMMNRLEYVRIWELGAAVQVGSSLENKDIVGKELIDLGNVARDLSDELVETNAMAVNAFTWLQWEFASLVQILSLPPAQRPSSAKLSSRLNQLLNRLSTTLTDLHKLASRSHAVAARGSRQGQELRTQLNTVGADLRKLHEQAPGWRVAVDKANHFLVGGDPSKAALIARDLSLTETTISSISNLVEGLEGTRSSIKGFRDQIGFFDASMMGFHLGASEMGGIGPEEEVRMLSEVVEEFGRAVGRAKVRSIPGRDGEADEARLIDA